LGWDAPFGFPQSSATTPTDVSVTYFAQFTPKQNETISKVSYYSGTITTGRAAAFGIYDSSCNLMQQGRVVGSVGSGAVLVTLSSPVSLIHGQAYYIGFAEESTVAFHQWGWPFHMQAMMNVAEPRSFRGNPPTGSGSTFSLPSHCGEPDTTTNPRYIPSVILFP
jgi:hypothetical protein